ncbi:MAG: MotA/TolQ/ExbB proton channel family protein [Opitutales bacterium]|jgi:biopolymer transport protein ExbB|tara:strand:+ start:785 stop:1612 length:828 start_codon:yes stop_codon:yes gene_type:complete
MKLVQSRTLLLLALLFSVLFPEMLVSVAQAQTKSFGSQLVDALGIFITPFAILVVGGFTLIIYNGIAIRRKAFVKDDVVQPIMQELQNLNIEGAKALCDQYKLPVTGVLKGGLERIQDDELDIESIEKGLEETSALELAKPFTWINMLNTIGSIAPMIGLLGTVTGMIGAFNVLTESGMGGESSKQMAGNIGSALWTTASGLVVAIPTLIAYFIYKTKFGTIVAEVNRVAGEMVFTLVRAARGGFEEGEDQEEYYEEEAVAAPEGLPEEMPPPAQ